MFQSLSTNLDDIFEKWFSKIRTLERDVKKLELVEWKLKEELELEKLQNEKKWLEYTQKEAI